MKKLLLTLILALVNTTVMAEWARVPGGEDAAFVVYTDSTTIRKAGNRVKMWDLRDYYKTAQKITGVKYLSTKNHTEYDCKEEQVRVLSAVLYSGKMGSGKAVKEFSDPDKWRPVPPDSLKAALWKIACDKK